MQRIITIFIFLFSVSSLCAQSRLRNQEKLKKQQEFAKELLDSYKFSEATELIQTNIEFAEKKNLDSSVLEEYLEYANTGLNMLTSTENVTFIDSIVIDKKQFLDIYRLGEAAGKISYFKDVFKNTNTNEKVSNSFTYIPQMQDKVYFSNLVDTALCLYTCDKLDDKWSEPVKAKGLESFGYDQISPFVLNDGTTMYFAAKGDQSFGGYDIFFTTLNTDNGKFLRPENIGMPFNSPANDYMYAIDEVNNLGWFVSDRRQPKNKVCVYVFIPNSTRQSYAFQSDSLLQNYAKINAIRDTWIGKTDMVKEALERLKNLFIDKEQTIQNKDFIFILNDQKTYTSLSDFKNTEAQKLAKQWKDAKILCSKQCASLNSHRDLYFTESKNKRKELSPIILQEEKQIKDLNESIKNLEKLIRKSELKK